MEYEKKIVDGTIVKVEVVPKLYLYLFLWCQLIYFSAGYSHHVQMAPGIRLMGHMHTSSRFKKNEDYAILQLRLLEFHRQGKTQGE